MLFLRLVLWLFIALKAAYALSPVSPYDLVYLYSAYKAEWAATLGDDAAVAVRKIAPGCKAKKFVPNPLNTKPAYLIAQALNSQANEQGIAGICNFREFMDHVGTKVWNKALAGIDLITDDPQLTRTLDPDPDRIYAAIMNKVAIEKMELSTLAKKLFSDAAFHAIDGNSVDKRPWALQLLAIRDILQDSRAKMAQKYVNDPSLKPKAELVESWTKIGWQCLEVQRSYRIGDNIRFVKDYIQTKPEWLNSPLSNPNIGVTKREYYTNMAGNQQNFVKKGEAAGAPIVDEPYYEAIDWETSVSNAAAAGTPISDETLATLKGYQQKFGSDYSSPDVNAKLHRDILQVDQGSIDAHITKVHDDLDGCLR